MRRPEEVLILEDDPLWYKDAIIYEIHVRTFYDSDADGVGDFRGLTEKLPYLQDLGVTAIWLLPFCPSPLRDEGYDISSYTGVHPTYGSLRDFKVFLREAHRRGLRVITELVVNHTSEQHPWFQRARRAKPGSRFRDFYVWSDNPEKYKDARIIFKDFEHSNWAWDPLAQAYYWHRFYAHQPDLNYDNPHVRRAVLQVLDFWLALGVDGLRLDAVPYLYEREGTTCENLSETHGFLKDLRRHVDKKFKNRMFLAEANQWPEDAVAYFGEGDECQMNFHFPLMPRLFMAIRREDRFPILDILQQTPPIPDTCQWALFLRNHDELTLEMVTDEDRDYMYRVYAHDYQARINLGIRRRLAPLLGNDRKKIELMNSLLFALPGTPVMYYGDEIGMGDNFYLGDRNGVRTPMQWSADRNAGFSHANPHKLYLPIIIDPEYHYEAINVETQQNNPSSLLWWTKRLISLRKRYKAFGRGSLEFLQPENRKVLAFVRRYQDENLLVVANLSRFVQHCELDLSPFKGLVPRELFGQTKFLPIGEHAYFLTLGPHSFYWFAMEPQPIARAMPVGAPEMVLPSLTVSGSWENVLWGRDKAALQAILPDYLRVRRWFGGKARTIQSTEILETIPIPHDAPVAYITLVRVGYTDGEPETYVLPLTYASGDAPAQVLDARVAVARLQVKRKGREDSGVLYDAMWDKGFATVLLSVIAHGRRFGGDFGEVTPSPTREFRPLLNSVGAFLEPSVVKAEQNNTSIVYGDLFVLKLFRRLDTGINPDLDIGRFLTEARNFPNIAPLASALEYRRPHGDPMTLAILHSYLPNEGEAWDYTVEALGRFYDRVLAQSAELQTAPLPAKPLMALIDEEISPLGHELMGLYLEDARLLGQRTGELHLALAEPTDNPDFSPEPFTDFYRRSVYQGMLSLTNQTFQLLRQRLKALPEVVRGDAQQVLDLEREVRRRFQPMRDRRITAMRIRCHGDYHLGQVLHTGRDFIIIDFEGEPSLPLSVRRLKRSPLRDVANMLRSFDYAARASLLGQVPGVRREDVPLLETWARCWSSWAGTTFLKAYLTAVDKAPFLPATREELQMLLDAYRLEKAIYEVGYELNNRPDWLRVPLQGVLQLLEAER